MIEIGFDVEPGGERNNTVSVELDNGLVFRKPFSAQMSICGFFAVSKRYKSIKDSSFHGHILQFRELNETESFSYS